MHAHRVHTIQIHSQVQVLASDHRQHIAATHTSLVETFIQGRGFVECVLSLAANTAAPLRRGLGHTILHDNQTVQSILQGRSDTDLINLLRVCCRVTASPTHVHQQFAKPCLNVLSTIDKAAAATGHTSSNSSSGCSPLLPSPVRSNLRGRSTVPTPASSACSNRQSQEDVSIAPVTPEHHAVTEAGSADGHSKPARTGYSCCCHAASRPLQCRCRIDTDCCLTMPQCSSSCPSALSL
jgi:hypothetical protein